MRKLISILLLTICIGSQAQDLPSISGIQISLAGLSKDKVISYKDLLKNEKFSLTGKNATGFELSGYTLSVVDQDKIEHTISKDGSFEIIKKLMNSPEKHEKVFLESFEVNNVREKKKYILSDQVVKITKGTK